MHGIQDWCDSLLEISKEHHTGGNPHAMAKSFIKRMYDYEEGKVLFKPTLAFGDHTYRLTKEGALSYFVGGDPDFPTDAGFALTHWVKASFESAGVIVRGDIGIFMGSVYLVDSEGRDLAVNKTMVFRLDEKTGLKILVHKSALPYIATA